MKEYTCIRVAKKLDIGSAKRHYDSSDIEEYSVKVCCTSKYGSARPFCVDSAIILDNQDILNEIIPNLSSIKELPETKVMYCPCCHKLVWGKEWDDIVKRWNSDECKEGDGE